MYHKLKSHLKKILKISFIITLTIAVGLFIMKISNKQTTQPEQLVTYRAQLSPMPTDEKALLPTVANANPQISKKP
jgi:hypothetical protein